MGKKELDQLETYRAELEALRHEYELYFMGVEKRRPTKTHQRLSRTIRRYSPGKDAIMRFRHQSLLQRLLSFERHWNRVLKAIEDGRYERDVFKADFRERKRVRDTDSTTPSGGRGAKAKEAGVQAAAFLAELSGAPTIGMRGQSKRAPASSKDSTGPAVALRGKPVGIKKPPPPLGLRGKPVGAAAPKKPAPTGLRGKPVGAAEAKKPAPTGLRGKPVSGAEPKKSSAPIGLRGKPVGRPKSAAPPPSPPAINMRGRSKKKDD